MGSTGKVALSVIMGLGAITGILSYYIFFNIAAPEPGVMPRASREPSPEGAATAPAASPPTGDGGGSKGNESQTATTTSPGGPSTVAGPAAATLTIPQGASVQGNPAYDPDPLTVKVGDTIAVNNKDTVPHTVTNGKDATDPNMGKLFDTSIINAGDSAEIVTTSMKPGEYPYHCSVHPYMTGTLTVQ
jgi:cytochrome c oxidase subunit II